MKEVNGRRYKDLSSVVSGLETGGAPQHTYSLLLSDQLRVGSGQNIYCSTAGSWVGVVEKVTVIRKHHVRRNDTKLVTEVSTGRV